MGAARGRNFQVFLFVVDEAHGVSAFGSLCCGAEPFVQVPHIRGKRAQVNVRSGAIHGLDEQVTSSHEALAKGLLRDEIHDAVEIRLLQTLAEQPAFDHDSLAGDAIANGELPQFEPEQADAQCQERDQPGT